jgi:hypothetical protein
MAALCIGACTDFGQGKYTQKVDVLIDKSFEDAGTPSNGSHEYHLQPKFYKAGELAPEQPIALTTAKKEAIELAKAKPTPLRKDCLNLIYTVDPIYSEGSIAGALKGTIVIKWDTRRRMWVFTYLKYQLLNIDQNACVFMLEAE